MPTTFEEQKDNLLEALVVKSPKEMERVIANFEKLPSNEKRKREAKEIVDIIIIQKLELEKKDSMNLLG